MIIMINVFLFIFDIRLFLIPLLVLLTVYTLLELKFKKQSTRYISMASIITVLVAPCLMVGYLKVPGAYINTLPYSEKVLIHNYENKYHRVISIRNLDFAKEASMGRFFGVPAKGGSKNKPAK
jgi:hypothetical protein